MNLTLEVFGLNLERLLRSAGEQGLPLRCVRRVDGRCVRVVLPVWKLKEFAALCEQYGWQMREVRAGIIVRMARLFKRRCMLGASVMLCVVLVWLSSGMIWKIEIEHAGENIAEVRRCLKAEGVRVGRLKRRVSTDELKDALALAVPGLAHAAARFEGSILVIDCHGARLGEQAGVAGEGSDIVAAQSGIVVRISAESGTPQVTAGQAVRKGQVLIRGQERTGGGGTRLCRAQGEIIARVFARGDARVSLNAVETVETGEVRRRVTMESPWHSRIVADAQDFDSQDVSVERQAVVGLYLPIWRRVETLARTVHKQEKRLLADARSQAQGAAEKIAKLNCPAGAEILDKWVDYSMIDDEFVYATVVLAFEEEIGTRGMPKAQIEP